ncbi:MAG: GAF domain-containing protein [Thermoplasmata archaeon]|nr:GAF domain-containing protein [Thermoplasmata archaeon]
MYNMLLVSADSGFTTLSLKFIPHLESSINVIPVKNPKKAVEAMETEAVDVILLDHSEAVDISDMMRSMDRAGLSQPILLVSKSIDKETLGIAINGGVAGYVDRSTADPMDYFREICQLAVIASERSRSKADRAVNEKRLEAVIEIARMAQTHDLSDIINYSLETAVKLTRSEAGFVASYDRERRVLRMLAWSRGAMKRCDMTNYPVEFQLDATGVWGDPIRNGRSIIINDYEGDRRLLKKGTPEGHMRLKRLLMIPIFSSEGAIMGTAGVGNKADEYTSADEKQFSLFMGEVFATFAKRESMLKATAPAQVVRELTDIGPIGLAFITTDMDLAFTNRMGHRILGIDPELELPVKLDDVMNGQVQSVSDLVNRLRTHGGMTVKGALSARIGERERNYSVAVYSTQGQEGMHPGFTVVMNDITDLKSMDQATSSMKEHVSILEGPVLDSLLEARPGLLIGGATEGKDFSDAVARVNETINFMSDYKNVGMMPAIWIDLEDAIRSARNVTLSADIKVSIRTNGIKVLADPAFPSVFRQLFSNSAMHGDYVTEISIRCAIQDGGLTIIYEDNGCGIDPEVRPKIFDMVYDGRFGMFLIYNIVSVSGFSIRCADRPRGAAFEISVPASKYSLG